MNKRPIHLSQIVHKSLAQTIAPAGLRRLVPVAWPILEVEHTIKIRIEEEIGVVERYLIEALARFGPMDSVKLAEFLGLEPFVVDAVVKNLQRFSEVISSADGVYATVPDALERLAEGKWSRTIESAESFYIDGIGDRLLPINLSKAHRSKWLRLDGAGEAGQISDYGGNKIKNLCWIASSGRDGMTALQEIIESGNFDQRQELGIPVGAYEVVSGKSTIKHERWLLALMEVTEDGSVTVHPAFMPNWSLANFGAEHRPAFEESLRRGTGSALGILNPDSDKRISNDVRPAWKPFIDYSANDGDFVVKLKDSMNLQFRFIDGETLDDESFEENEAISGQQLSMPKSLLTVLRFPFWWHSSRYAVRQVVPGDIATAEALLLLRGMDELRGVAGRAESEDVDLASWWEEFQERASADWPSELNECRVPKKKMLSEASGSPEGQVVELVSEYL